MEIKVNSPENQAIKSAFVGREVLANVTAMAEYILTNESEATPFCWGDVANAYAESERQLEIITELRSITGIADGNSLSVIQESSLMFDRFDYDEAIYPLIDEWDEIVSSYTKNVEVAEWWIVTEFLMEQLRSHGECVIPHMNMWGRQSNSGTSIHMDKVIDRICLELNLLN